MRPSRRLDVWARLRRRNRAPPGPRPPDWRGQLTHVIILDGTLSRLQPGHETNAGLTARLLKGQGLKSGLTVYYEPGIQWPNWRHTHAVMTGRGINRQIKRAYGVLASRYRPGDRIFLFGYSRGAYAIRSLGGLIDRVGLLRPEHATPRLIELGYRHYRLDPDGRRAREFETAYCWEETRIEMMGLWDTVRALGLEAPLLWRFSQPEHDFHDHRLGPSIQHGFHALAIDERRMALEPVLWECPPTFRGHVEQLWFPGEHPCIGGQLNGKLAVRPLSNLPLVWILEKAEGLGLSLPPRWRDRFPVDVHAPSLGMMHGFGKFFLIRRTRRIGEDRSEALHPSVNERRVARGLGPVVLRAPVSAG